MQAALWQITIARHAARFAGGVVLMTAEQTEAARATMPRRAPLIDSLLVSTPTTTAGLSRFPT